MRFWDWITGKHAFGATAAISCEDCEASWPELLERTTCAVLDEPQPEPDQELQSNLPWWQPAGPCFLELASPSRPEMAGGVEALENLILLQFDGHNLSLPSLPHVPEQVLQKLSSPNCSMHEIAEEIGNDQVTAAAVLRMANSPFYRGLQKTTAIEPAVVRLGGNAIRTVMLNLSMRSVAFQEKRKGTNRAEMLWQRAVAGATIMRALSQFTTLDPDEAFLIGLLHDVGNIIVLRILNAQRVGASVEVDDETFEYLCHEAHQEFGELLADAWGLPERLKALICDHHVYPQTDGPFRTERLQLHLTDMIGSALRYSPYFSCDVVQSHAARDLGLSDRHDFRLFLDGLADLVEESLGSLA